jgi:hypothetical protein
VLVAAAQPLQTDDAWWHLALGRAYASAGPWLPADPLLHTATAAPEPTAWLFDLGLYAVGRVGGFHALRVAHALAIAGILALVWSLLHRASGSRNVASLGGACFAALAAYRLFQLRPELATIAATLLLYRCLLEEPKPPAWRRVALGALLLALWVNLHSGFLLGPLLLGAALGGLLLAAAIARSDERSRLLARACRLAAALGLGLVASLVNPTGVAPHLAYFRAGLETPDLTRVVDEWASVDLLRFPLANLPPSPLGWALVWTLLVASIGGVILAAIRLRRDGSRAKPALDPALAGTALASLVAMLLAVRFLWLGIFPLLLLARGAAGVAAERSRRTLRIGAAALCIAIVPGFLRLGDWPMISGSLPHTWTEYRQPFLTAKYNANAVWMLADAGVVGKLFNDYFMGGFLGYWLAPGLQGFANGTLNFPIETLRAQSAIAKGRGLGSEESMLDLLDRYAVDVFLGVRLPQLPWGNRPRIYTSGHLERAPGWLPVYRDLASAVYLRADARNRANLERVAAYYAREGVPFDPILGFDPAAVVRADPAWAAEHGLVPRNFEAILADANGPDPALRRSALDRLASLWLALGAYEEAIALDRRLLRSNPGANAPTRRLVWSLLRVGRADEAKEASQSLASVRSPGISAAITRGAQRSAAGLSDDDRRALLARLPVFTATEAGAVLAGVADPPLREWRR